MNTELLKQIEGDYLQNRPEIKVGDTVKLHMKIKDGDKERIQIFEGIVIAMKGEGISQAITVRKISMGVGVERIVPLHSPLLAKVEVTRRGDKVRRSKLYYMRDRVGKRAMKIKGGVSDIYLTDEVEVPVPVEDVAVEEVVAEGEVAPVEETPAAE